MIRVGGAPLFDLLLHPHDRPVSSNFLSVFGCPWQTLEFGQLDLELLEAKKNKKKISVQPSRGGRMIQSC